MSLTSPSSGLILAVDALVPDALTDAFRHAIELLRFHEIRLRSGEVEAVHQFRVTLRRLRALFEFSAPLLHAIRLRFYRDAVHAAGDAAGAVRDLDVLSERLRTLSESRAQPSAAGPEAVYAAMSEERAAALEQLVSFTQSNRYQLFLTRLAQPMIKKIPQNERLRALAMELARPAFRAVARAGAQLDRSPDPHTMHRLRIRLKRLRYTIEMLRELSDKRGARLLKRLRRLQDLLGEHQDLVNLADWLQKYSHRQDVPTAALVEVGVILQIGGERRQKIADRAIRRWKKLQHREIIEKARHEITLAAHSKRQSRSQHEALHRSPR